MVCFCSNFLLLQMWLWLLLLVVVVVKLSCCCHLCSKSSLLPRLLVLFRHPMLFVWLVMLFLQLLPLQHLQKSW